MFTSFFGDRTKPSARTPRTVSAMAFPALKRAQALRNHSSIKGRLAGAPTRARADPSGVPLTESGPKIGTLTGVLVLDASE